MSVNEWEIGDYIVGKIEEIGHNEFGYLGKSNQVRILGEADPDELILAQITDTQAVGVVAESVSGIDTDSATVWVQRTTDINPRDPDSGEPSNTFDEMVGGKVADKLPTTETTTRDRIQIGLLTSLGYGVRAILVGSVGLLIIGYGVKTVIPPEGLIEFLILFTGPTIGSLILWLSLTLLAVGIVAVTTAIKSAILD